MIMTNLLDCFGLSDRGPRHRVNEDQFLVVDLDEWNDVTVAAGDAIAEPPASQTSLGVLLLVADGVGGNPGGDVAAQMAVDVLWSMAKRTSRFDLGRAVRTANAEIFLTGREHPELRHLCTTLTAVYIADTATNPHLHTVNVGDSRLYMLRNDTLTQLTTDDAVTGLVPGDQGVRSRRMLTRALGLHSNLDLQISDVALHNGDRLMLCTDGITNELSRRRDPRHHVDARPSSYYG